MTAAIMRYCLQHGVQPGKCPHCYKADNARRRRKQQQSGRTTAHWQRLKAQAKAEAGYRCQECGRAEERHARGWLSVHLTPELQGDHRAATINDVTVLCLSCHGALDAPRASR